VVYFVVDAGTTNTTVWLMEESRVLRQLSQPVGARNTSIAGNRLQLKSALQNALLSLAKGVPSPPRFILAAGMITSSSGFLEVPHVLAPAGADELAQRVVMKTFRAISPLPFFLVPGVRVNPAPCELASVECTDIIRGEETEIVGLLARRERALPVKPWLFLHLGSHAKAIQVDAEGRIVNSVSTLSGECLQVLRTQTILASRLAHLKPAKLHERFFQQGCRCTRRHGLLRALFMVRLLEENRHHTQAQLYSFLLGSLLVCDLQAFESHGLLNSRSSRILLSGRPDLQLAWKLLLRKRAHEVVVVDPRTRVSAFLAGLRKIVFASPAFRRFTEGEAAWALR
jgi:2-dehydro-3-deoxygalactonokinase